jgi:hypothetical protein
LKFNLALSDIHTGRKSELRKIEAEKEMATQPAEVHGEFAYELFLIVSTIDRNPLQQQTKKKTIFQEL